MKKVSAKTLMVLTIMVASFTATPAMASTNWNEEEYSFDQIGDIGGAEFITGFESMLGGLFHGMGYAGNLLGAVFSMLLMQTLENFNDSEILPNVYTLSASTKEIYNGTRNYGNNSIEIFTLPYEYDQSYLESNNKGYAYCVVNTSGTVNYEIEYGAALTLVIWDNDGSFIEAVKRIVSFFKILRPYLDESTGFEGVPKDLIQAGVELVSWLLIHINDIFTGEELFALNPLTWQKITLNASADFSVEKTWKVTGSDWRLNPNSDEDLFGAVGLSELSELNFQVPLPTLY